MKRLSTLEKEVSHWNAKVKVGDTVAYRDYPEAPPQTFTTRTPAEILSGHTAVVWLTGKAGCVCIEACKPIATPSVKIRTELETEYNGYKLTVTKHADYGSHPFEWHIEKDGIKHNDPTSWQNAEAAMIAGKQAIDYYVKANLDNSCDTGFGCN